MGRFKTTEKVVEIRNRTDEPSHRLMKDQELASFLDAQEQMWTFDQLMQKYTASPYNLSKEALWNKIIDSSMSGRGLVDSLFGIG